MVIEIRIYRTKPGQRARFSQFIDQRSGPIQRAKGIHLLGPFVSMDDEDIVICFREFATPQERDRLRQSFYESSEWKNELKAEAKSMLDSYKVIVAKSSSDILQ